MELLTVIANKENIKNGEILISDKNECNHVQNVFRLNVGDELRVVDGEFEYNTEIIGMAKNKIHLKIKAIIEDKYSNKREIDIALGVLKNDKMNLAIQKLTELGISKIIPMETSRTVVKLNEKKEKWETIVKEAVKQCKSVKFTKIHTLTKIEKIDYSYYNKIIYAYENSEECAKLCTVIDEKDEKILYIIGPEGGFTEKEVNFLKEKNAIEISLGKRILRAETAAIVLGGILTNL